MPVTVVVGGQFGSEGKGKVAHEFAKMQRASVAVRVGGSNSGHTVIDPQGAPIVFRHLPTAALLPDTICVLPAGSYIDPAVLAREVEVARLPRERLLIDPNASVISSLEKEDERKSSLKEQIGSTGSGTGAAVSRRIRRDGSATLAADHPVLSLFKADTRTFLRKRLDVGERTIIEGTQGFGLSLLHSEHYPYVTSRDTTAAAFVSEAGLSPLDVDEVVLVIRAFPIRVAGSSGQLTREIDWKTISSESGAASSIAEYTSVTGLLRRVARFDPSIVKLAIQANAPSQVVLNHVDYVDMATRNSTKLSSSAERFVHDVQLRIGANIDYIGIGPEKLLYARPEPPFKLVSSK